MIRLARNDEGRKYLFRATVAGKTVKIKVVHWQAVVIWNERKDESGSINRQVLEKMKDKHPDPNWPERLYFDDIEYRFLYEEDQEDQRPPRRSEIIPEKTPEQERTEEYKKIKKAIQRDRKINPETLNMFTEDE